MIDGGMPHLRRARVRALGTSAIISAALLAGPAFAQCAPEPTVAGGETNCSGTDADGLLVSTFGTQVSVLAGASVRGAGGSAVTVQIGSNDGFGAPVKVAVAGAIEGGADAGVSFRAQAIPDGFYNQSLDLNVAAGGSVTGSNGIVVGRASDQFYGSAGVNIDNSGTITGTGGIALLSTDPFFAGFSSITNRTGGYIGAISGPVGTLDNQGTIDGGARSAIDWGTSQSGAFVGERSNGGLITATSADATLANLPSSFGDFANSGTIENRGSGVAIAGSVLSITNAAGGRIASAGGTAIVAADVLFLTNAGTIDGDVVVASTSSFGGSRVDSTAGRINGALQFAAGADTLVADYDGTQLQYGVTGAIDGGAGNDTVRVEFTHDVAVATPLMLPTNFEQFTLAPNAGVTATLAPGFTAAGTLVIGGSGTLVNRTVLSNAGTVIAQEFGSFDYPVFVNAGSIVSTAGATGAYAVALNSLTRFENNGTIDAAQNGVSLFGSGAFVNSGVITAAGTGVFSLYDSFANTGTIRSTGGTGAVILGSGNGQSNTGRIEGAIAGAELGGYLANAGVITGNQTGVVLSGYGTLVNQAGGTVISTNGPAIAAQNPGGTNFSFNTTVANAGTILGDVVLGDTQSLYYSNNNRFFALPGGTLNGNLTLGQGDLLVTELVGTGPGAFAGINGNVSATGSLLRLRVREDASATLIAPTGFASVGYELLNDASLTLTGSGPSLPLTLAGHGSVDLAADISATTAPALLSTSLSLAPGETSTTPTALTITSHGTLSLTRTDPDRYVTAAVVLGGDDSFTNAGTIIATDRTGVPYNTIAAIAGGYPFSGSGGSTVINTGTITLDGAIGVLDASTIINSGTIAQAAGGAAATGVQMGSTNSARRLVNSGTIDVAGAAVRSDYAAFTIDNSGRLTSSGGAAIVATNGYGLVINNASGGTIAGGNGTAIQTGGGSLDNAGTITGTVDLGYSNTGGRSYSNANYTADGGTITGDLLFGSGSDQFVSFGTLGVSGTIDGGDGIDTLIQARRASDTVTLDFGRIINFEAFGVRALGADTVVTVRADAPFAGDLVLSGDGAVVNTATIAGTAYVQNPGSFVDGVYQPGPVLAGFTNQGEIAGGFSGETRRFVNSGTIGATTLAPAAVLVQSGGPIAFANDGRILNGGATPAVSLATFGGNSIAASNSGSIGGGFSAYAASYASSSTRPVAVSLDNSGTVAAAGTYDSSVRLTAEVLGGAAGTVTLSNSGTIEATGQAGAAAELFAYLGEDSSAQLVVSNTGTLRANAGGYKLDPEDPNAGASVGYPFTYAASALRLVTGGGEVRVVNGAAGTIEATGEKSVAIEVLGGTLDLANAGSIRGGAGTVLTADDRLGEILGRSYLAGAIESGNGDDRIANTGSITGSIDLGGGADRIENDGRIDGNVFLGAGDDRFSLGTTGSFAGSVDGGEGVDTIDIAGGSAATPVAFVDATAIEALAMSGGYASVSGTASFGTIDLSGGRLVSLAGSTIGASQIMVRQGATFGSAGIVNGNLTVAGVLSPGASPGTMTVNGNVALGATSLSLFELAPTVQDKLVVNGALSIAPGATLQLVPIGTLRPGVSYDLITASGGITGSFTTMVKPDDVFGLLVQRADRIQLLGQFLADQAFSPQVSRSIAYANAALAAQPADSPLFAALPALLTASGASNPQAFAQLTPEPYASATQLGVDNALTLVDTARGPAFATERSVPGAFTFAQAVGSWYRLGGDHAQGSALARTNSYGFLGGVGYGDRTWSIGAFGGWLDSRQRLDTLGAATKADGFVAGVHGRYDAGSIGLTASLAYNGANGTTTRALPGTASARGRYDLTSWIGDVAISYALDVGADWTLRPRVGVTYLRTTRDALVEQGSVFALTVARDRHKAGFADTGITFGRSVTSDAAWRPFVGLGVRYQFDGRRTDALAGYAGGPIGLEAVGASRARAVGTANAGLVYRVTPGLDLFSTVSAQTGRDDHRESISTGVRLRF